MGNRLSGIRESQELVTLANGVVVLPADVAHDDVLGSRTVIERRRASEILLMMVG